MELVSHNKCFGCGACYSVCSKKAIIMKPDDHGFRFPEINGELCVNCGLCKKACPADNNDFVIQKDDIKVYAVKNKNQDTVLKSSSGGLFSALSEYVFSQNGVVYGVVLNDDFRAVFSRATSQDEVVAQRRSKYVQSDVGVAYIQVIEDLKKQRWVLFSGTACQCAGLIKAIPGSVDQSRLITVDLICNGVPSPLLFQEYIKYCENKSGKKIKTHIFRTKDVGYRHRLHVGKNIFEDGSVDTTSEYSQAWKTLFYTGNAHRECCFECPFAYVDKRPADITIGDYWGAEDAGVKLPVDGGLSVYFANNEKGKELINKLEPYLAIEESDIESAIKKQPRMRGVLAKKDNREQFWKEYDKKGFKYVIEKYGRCSRYIIFKHKIKKMLIKMKIIKASA